MGPTLAAPRPDDSRRTVRGPDGYLYLLTDADDGRILRIEPAK
ncbi:MAG TPA: hypothetical protein VGJ75_01785 [Dongiaceae bacterium]